MNPIALALALLAAPLAAPATTDVTAKLEALEGPAFQRWPSGEMVYARNPWALRAFGGKLYVGSGNSNNKGPAANAGPIDLYVYDPGKKAWSVEAKIEEEQVDVIRVLGGELWIPGHDGRLVSEKASKLKKALSTADDWSFGATHHRLKSGRWEHQRTIKNGIHVYDLVLHKGKLFAAASTVAGGTVARSEDGGGSWKESLTSAGPWQRTRSLFELDGRLYASTSKGKLYRYDEKTAFAQVNKDLFPGKDRASLFAARPTPFAAQVAYLGARQLIDHDWDPIGLFAIGADLTPRKLSLPGNATARDLLVEGGKLHALASSKEGGKLLVQVFATADLKTWTEELRFVAPTFARSFEKLGGDWYFGLGSDPLELNAATGRILKVAAGR